MAFQGPPPTPICLKTDVFGFDPNGDPAAETAAMRASIRKFGSPMGGFEEPGPTVRHVETVCEGRELTHDEQTTPMTRWPIAPPPPMFGGNLPDNDEVLEVKEKDSPRGITWRGWGKRRALPRTQTLTQSMWRSFNKRERTGPIPGCQAISPCAIFGR